MPMARQKKNAKTLLSNYQDPSSSGCHLGGNKQSEMETSFAQCQNRKKKAQLSRIRCFKCNEFGQVKKDCPHNNASNVQQEEEDSDEQSVG